MRDDVYCLPVRGRRLLSAPLCGIAAEVNAGAAALVQETLCGDKSVPTDSPLTELIEDLRSPVLPPAIRRGPATPPFLGLVLTRGCNMACHYCDFASGCADGRMAPGLVSQAVLAWVTWMHDLGHDALDLRFFGGEPFTQPDLIEIAVHRARYLAGQQTMTLRVEASTNGLLSSRLLGFVQDHFDAIVLSLDGPADDHNRHRPLRSGAGSFDEVWRTAMALAASPVALCVRCCVSDASVGHMAETAAWLCRELRPAEIAFEPLKPTPGAEAAGLSPPAPLQFARRFWAARRLAEEAGVRCVYAPLEDGPRRTFCPVGLDTFIVAPDRSVRSCYLRRAEWEACGLDLRIGEVAADGSFHIEHEAILRLRQMVADRRRCVRCFCRWNCAGGCLVAETPPGHSLQYTDFCRQTRLLQACALLETMGLPSHADELLADEDAVAALWEHADDRLGGGNVRD